MKRFRTIAAMMLTVSALAMVCSESDAQTRRSETTTTSRQGTATRQGASARQAASPKKGTVTRQGAATQRQGASTQRQTTSNQHQTTSTQRQTTARTSAPANRPTNSSRPVSTTSSRSTVTGSKPSTTIKTRPTVTETRPSTNTGTRQTTTRPTNRVDTDRPMEVNHPDEHRVHPRDREFMHYNAPSYFWAHDHHCYGHRVRVLPSHALRHHWCGHVYYCYHDIWYRPYGGYYVVCRPPFGTVLAAQVISDMAWASVRISYYNTVARTYDAINANNKLIAEQNAVIEQNNRVIAQNNALIAAQNQAIAQGQKYAAESYAKANELGLIQSFADADETYYYQDGVFYSMGADGQYMVIIPPAGALVENLPEDYDMVTLKGDEYYKVDDTIYKVTIKEGKPYFEVLGQLYS